MLGVGCNLYSDEGEFIYCSFQSDSDNSDSALGTLEKKVSLRSKLPNDILRNGTYSLEFNASIYGQEWINQPGVNTPSVFFKIDGPLSSSPYWTENRGSILAPLIAWERC
jgi:hypothetical protein